MGPRWSLRIPENKFAHSDPYAVEGDPKHAKEVIETLQKIPKESLGPPMEFKDPIEPADTECPLGSEGDHKNAKEVHNPSQVVPKESMGPLIGYKIQASRVLAFHLSNLPRE